MLNINHLNGFSSKVFLPQRTLEIAMSPEEPMVFSYLRVVQNENYIYVLFTVNPASGDDYTTVIKLDKQTYSPVWIATLSPSATVNASSYSIAVDAADTTVLVGSGWGINGHITQLDASDGSEVYSGLLSYAVYDICYNATDDAFYCVGANNLEWGLCFKWDYGSQTVSWARQLTSTNNTLLFVIPDTVNGGCIGRGGSINAGTNLIRFAADGTQGFRPSISWANINARTAYIALAADGNTIWEGDDNTFRTLRSYDIAAEKYTSYNFDFNHACTATWLFHLTAQGLLIIGTHTNSAAVDTREIVVFDTVTKELRATFRLNTDDSVNSRFANAIMLDDTRFLMFGPVSGETGTVALVEHDLYAKLAGTTPLGETDGASAGFTVYSVSVPIGLSTATSYSSTTLSFSASRLIHGGGSVSTVAGSV